MAADHKSQPGMARVAFFSKRDTVFDAIERGELPKKIWAREFASPGPPAISYAQFMRLLNRFAPSPLKVLMGKKVEPVGHGVVPIKVPVANGPIAPAVEPASGSVTTSNSQPQRPPTFGRINPTPYKFGDLKIDLNEVYGLPPEKKPDR